MSLATIDWVIIGAFLLLSLLIGLYASKSSGKSSKEFFLSGRSMPWWLLGVSMVATTFSADTPNLVADIIRQNGVSGNWQWWAFCLTGMLTVFVYARLWRKSEVFTDLEFYELRYSGKAAAFLRGFRAVYLGLILNVLIMATVCLAASKIGKVLLGLEEWQTLVIASVVTVIYSLMGGLRGVILTDFVQFIIAMIGSIWATVVVVGHEQVGGMSTLLTHPNVADKLSFFPDFSNPEAFIPLFIIPIAIQWWSTWYPGAEPGGGGYIAQRMLSAKDSSHAVKATLFFNIAHYAIRPWPWILIGLASLIVFPMDIPLDALARTPEAEGLGSLKAAFPDMDEGLLGHDVAYPAMLRLLPVGLVGLVMASLVAAFMSTISTHLNWGASYLVNDVYKRFINPEADEKKLVLSGRVLTAVLMVFAAVLSLFFKNALQVFNILVLLGAGTGLLFILRWFWWRINAMSEVAAMVISFVVAIGLQIAGEIPAIAEMIPPAAYLPLGLAITTFGWLIVTFATQPTDPETLKRFYKKVRPYGKGWKQFLDDDDDDQGPTTNLPIQILAMSLGCLMVFCLLFGTGSVLYGHWIAAGVLFSIAIISALGIARFWKHIIQ